MLTVFGNIVNIRVTQQELVLEFGSFFQDRPGVGPPSDYKPEIRIVLNKAALPALAQGLANAQNVAVSVPSTPTADQPKRTVGFSG